MSSPERIEPTTSGRTATFALYGAQLMWRKTAVGQEHKPGIALIDPGGARRWRFGITLQCDCELHDALKDAVDLSA